MIFLVKHDFSVLYRQEYCIGASLPCTLSFFSHLKMLVNKRSSIVLHSECNTAPWSNIYIYMCNVQNLHSAVQSGNRNIFSFLFHLFYWSFFPSFIPWRLTGFFARITKFVPKTPIKQQITISPLSKYCFYFARSCAGNKAYVNNWKSIVEVYEKPLPSWLHS